MNLNDLIYDYAGAHSSSEPEWLRRIDCDTNLLLLNPRMCSGHVQGRLLTFLTSIINPNKVLEIGTYSGYSALCMAEGLQRPDSWVDTIEIDDELEDFIHNHFALAPTEISSRVRLHIGDALGVIDSLEPGWELSFIDADKRCYNDYLDALLPLVPPGAVIIADNTFWGGNVVDAGHNRDPRTVAIRKFNDRVASDPCLEVVMLPLRDGLTLIRKK